jgi:hypothetical protein
MDPLGPVDDGSSSIPRRAAPDLDPGGAQDPIFGNRDRHEVAAEIREVLRQGMELVVVPAPLTPEDRDFREPLSHEVEVTDESGAGDDMRELRLEVEFELDHPSRLHDPRQLHTSDGEVIRIAVVRPHELHRREEIGAVIEGQTADPNPAPISSGIGLVAQGPQVELTHEGGPGARECVEVEVDVDLVGGHIRVVDPADLLGALQAMGFGIEDDLDLIVGGVEGGGRRCGPATAHRREDGQK